MASSPAPASPPPPVIDLETLAAQLSAQLLLERDMLLAWVDERERMLNIKPRTAEVRKWWREQNGCRINGQNGGGHAEQNRG